MKSRSKKSDGDEAALFGEEEAEHALDRELAWLEMIALPYDENGHRIDAPIPFPEVVGRALRLCADAGRPVPIWCCWAAERMAKDLRNPPKRKPGGDVDFVSFGRLCAALSEKMQEYPDWHNHRSRAMRWAAKELADHKVDARQYRDAYHQVERAMNGFVGRYGEEGFQYLVAERLGINPLWRPGKLST